MVRRLINHVKMFKISVHSFSVFPTSWLFLPTNCLSRSINCLTGPICLLHHVFLKSLKQCAIVLVIHGDVRASTTYFRLVSDHQTQLDFLIFFWWRAYCRIIFFPCNVGPFSFIGLARLLLSRGFSLCTKLGHSILICPCLPQPKQVKLAKLE